MGEKGKNWTEERRGRTGLRREGEELKWERRGRTGMGEKGKNWNGREGEELD